MSPRPLPPWLETAVIYQIYPQSFQDSNGDGIGDLPGIISRLDYIASLGVDAIWLNPIFESPFGDAGYDVADYCKVAPRYGTQGDLERLIAEAKARGIRILLDFVPGHTSVEHPWFQASARPEPNAYTNRYVWTDNWWRKGEGGIAGSSERNGCYLPNYYYFQPALNYGYAKPEEPWQLPTDHPDVIALREDMKDVLRHWLRLGVAGFRVDMAASLVRNDPDQSGIFALWRDIRGMLDLEFPGTVLISEWGHPPHALQAGFDIDFILPFLEGNRTVFSGPEQQGVVDYSRAWFHRNGLGNLAEYLERLKVYLSEGRGLGHFSIVTGNHDIERVNFERTTDELEAIFTFAMTMPGVPFLYYGDEIGLRQRQPLPSKERGYNRTSARTPMQWDDSPNAGFSTASPDALYTPIDPAADRPTVAAQEADPDALLARIRRLVRWRKEVPAFAASAPFEVTHLGASGYPLVYRRGDADTGVVVLIFNPSGTPTEAPLPWAAETLESLRDHGVELHGHRARCAPGSFGVYRLRA